MSRRDSIVRQIKSYNDTIATVKAAIKASTDGPSIGRLEAQLEELITEKATLAQELAIIDGQGGPK